MEAYYHGISDRKTIEQCKVKYVKVLMCCCQNNDRCINSHHYHHCIMKNRKLVQRNKQLNRTNYKHFMFYSLYYTYNGAYVRLLSMEWTFFSQCYYFFLHKINLNGSRTKTTKKKTKHEHNLLLTQIRFSIWCVYDPLLFSVL